MVGEVCGYISTAVQEGACERNKVVVEEWSLLVSGSLVFRAILLANMLRCSQCYGKKLGIRCCKMFRTTNRRRRMEVMCRAPLCGLVD